MGGDFTNGRLQYDTLKGRWLPIDTAETTRLESSAVKKGILLRTMRHEGKARSTGIALLSGAASKNSGCCLEGNYELKKTHNILLNFLTFFSI